MDALTGWLGGVPLGALYALIFAASLVEGILPLMPGDVAAAFLAFMAARAGGTLTPTILAVTGGSVIGALIVWWAGRRYGADWLARRMHRMGLTRAEHQIEEAEQRVEAAYRRYGWVALFVSRFVPGVRAVVPAAAGALRVPFWEVTVIFTLASTLWYGTIAWIAFHVGRDWASVKAAIAEVARDVGAGSIAVALVLVLIGWRLVRRRRADIRGVHEASSADGDAGGDGDAGNGVSRGDAKEPRGND